LRGGVAALNESVTRVTAAAGEAGVQANDVWPALARLEVAGDPAYAAVCPPASLPELLATMHDGSGYVAAHGADGEVRRWGASASDRVRSEVLRRGWVWRDAGRRSVRADMDERAAQLERQIQSTFDPAGILVARMAVLA
jgi:hypothetical protein